jgi:geranylgeranyl diphosphate synthase type I
MTTLDERTARPVSQVLSWSRTLVDPALHTGVDTLPEPMRRIASYHFGWQDEHGQPAKTSGGKALRPALTLLSAEAVGGCASHAMTAAAAVELVHNFSLLHDDVMDADITRRHRPTAWSVFGVSQAILAGDALLALALNLLAANATAVRVLADSVQSLIDGQSLDLTFEKRTDVSLAECQLMAEKKSASLLRAACVLGGLYGGGEPEQIEHLGGFGARLGLAFQLVDDLLGIWGDPAVTGKPVYSDLRSRKKSLPIVAALISPGVAGRQLAEMYHSGRPMTQPSLIRAAELVQEAGGRRWALEQADEQLGKALNHLRHAGLDATRTTELVALAHLVTRRDF